MIFLSWSSKWQRKTERSELGPLCNSRNLSRPVQRLSALDFGMSCCRSHKTIWRGFLKNCPSYRNRDRTRFALTLFFKPLWQSWKSDGVRRRATHGFVVSSKVCAKTSPCVLMGSLEQLLICIVGPTYQKRIHSNSIRDSCPHGLRSGRLPPLFISTLTASHTPGWHGRIQPMPSHAA